MTPHQALALGVRLFAVWYALLLFRELLAFLVSWRPPDDPSALVLVITGLVVSAGVLVLLWRFPKSIARGLLPQAAEAPAPSSSYEMWFTLGAALIGLWFVASAIAPILRNLSILLVFRPELASTEDLRSLKVGIFYYSGELILGLCLLFGATGIRKLVWRIRNAALD